MANPNPKPGPGRPKGCKNVFQKSLKEIVFQAIQRLEEENKSLPEEASKDPKWFFENFVKPMLPKEVALDVKGKVKVSLTVIKNAAHTD